MESRPPVPIFTRPTEIRKQKRKMHAVSIDFEKAFNKISHFYLMKKLDTLNLPSHLLNVIHSFLENRKGFINYNNFNPLNTLLLLKSLKILKKFKNFFLSFNGDRARRALPRMIQNVVLGSFESIFNALATKLGHFL